MTSYPQPAKSFSINHLEQLLYTDEPRDQVYTRLFTDANNTPKDLFMLTLFKQLDLERSYHNTIHQKYSQYHEYMVKFHTLIAESSGIADNDVFSIVNDNQHSRQIYLRHAIMQLQTVLVALGATDNELIQLNLFGDSCVNVIQQ